MHPWHTIALDIGMSHWKLYSTCALACGLFVFTSMRDCCGCSSAPCCCEERSGSWGPRPRRPSLLPRGCHHHPPFHPKTRLLPTTKRHHSTAERNIHNAFILIFRTAHQWCFYVCVLPSAVAGLCAVVCAFFQPPAGCPGGCGAWSAFPAQGWVLHSSPTRSLRNPDAEPAGATSSANPAAGENRYKDKKKERECERKCTNT